MISTSQSLGSLFSVKTMSGAKFFNRIPFFVCVVQKIKSGKSY
jgi:hypothetical protein